VPRGMCAELAHRREPDADAEHLPPSKGDAHAYLVVRDELASIGVDLVDAMIVDGDFHWWSMRDLERPGQPYDLRADEVAPTSRGVWSAP
jgi:hypothetical protein